MDTQDGVLVIVRSPKDLPAGIPHSQSIQALSRKYTQVLLFSFGDEKYDVAALPPNCQLLPYSYDTLDDDLGKLQATLSGFGMGLMSRHKELGRLPFILAGSVITVPQGRKVVLLDHTVEPERIKSTSTNKWLDP